MIKGDNLIVGLAAKPAGAEALSFFLQGMVLLGIASHVYFRKRRHAPLSSVNSLSMRRRSTSQIKKEYASQIPHDSALTF